MNDAREHTQGETDSIDPLPPAREHLDTAWVQEHLNMKIALSAYQEALAGGRFGPTPVKEHVTAEKLALLRQRLTVQHLEGATFRG